VVVGLYFNKKNMFGGGGGGGIIELKMCVLIFSTNVSEIFLILRRIQRNIVIYEYSSSCRVPLF